MIAFFAEFDPVEYNFDDDGASFDVVYVVFIIVLIISIAWFLSTPLVPGVVIIFIIVLSHDDDDADDDDDEKRFLPNCKRLLVNAFDALVVRVVQYKSIVFVVTENAREAYLCLSRFFPKRAALLEETSDPKSFTKTHLARTLCFSVLEREAFTKRHLCGQRRRRRQQQRSVSA